MLKRMKSFALFSNRFFFVVFLSCFFTTNSQINQSKFLQQTLKEILFIDEPNQNESNRDRHYNRNQFQSQKNNFVLVVGEDNQNKRFNVKHQLKTFSSLSSRNSAMKFDRKRKQRFDPFKSITDRKSSINKWKFMALVFVLDEKNSILRLKCTAVVLSERFLLTSADCFYDFGANKNLSNLKVLFGGFTIKQWRSFRKCCVRTIADILIYDDQQPANKNQSNNQNLAIIRIDERIEFGEEIEQVPLALDKNENDPSRINEQNVTTKNLNITEEDYVIERKTCLNLRYGPQFDGRLVEFILPLLNNDQCVTQNQSFQSEQQICAGFLPPWNNRTISLKHYLSDAGSPLFCRINKRYSLIGIENLPKQTIKIESLDPSEHLRFLTNVLKFLDWIQTNGCV